MEPRLQAIGRAVPERAWTQDELFALAPWEPTPLLERLFLDSAIATRHLFVPPDWYRTSRRLTETNEAWKQGATRLAGRALGDGLDLAGWSAGELDFLAVTSVTGYTTPGLDLLLMRDHGLRPDTRRAHFNCIGCHAAVPLLKVAADHVRARPDTKAAAIAVEVCSACFSADPDAQNLVALSLFGDGAAAAMIGTGGDGPILVDFGALYDFEHLHALGFGLTTSGFRIVLDPSIPTLIATNIERAVDGLLDRAGVSRDAVGMWCFHPGGARILDEVQRRLGLPDGAMRPSRRILRSYGNMSSPSILFVLAEALRTPPPPGSWAVLAAFGPGLGIETALLRFE